MPASVPEVLAAWMQPFAVYFTTAVWRLATAEEVPDHLSAHLSPLGWEHLNLTGDYVWSPADEATENHGGFRPLRPVPDPALLAA